MKYETFEKPIEEKDLVAKNYEEYYKPIFDQIRKGDKKSFNLWAMLVSPYWYIYRKMVSHGALVIGAQIMLLMLSYVTKKPLFIGLLCLSFLEYVRAGFYGNYDYYKSIQSKVEFGNTVELKYRQKYINDKSGVDLQIAIAWVFGSIAIGYIALFV